MNNLLVRDLIPWTIETADMIGVANYVKAAKLIYIPRAENNEVSGPGPAPHRSRQPLPWRLQSGCSHCPGSAARGHDDLVSSANMGWTPTKNIFVKKLNHIPILILLGLLLWIIHCVERRQWYESGHSSGGGACVPGSVHAYPSSGGEYSWDLPAAPRYNMQFLSSGLIPALITHVCSHTLQSSPVWSIYSCNIIFIWHVWFPGELTPDQDQEVWVGRS